MNKVSKEKKIIQHAYAEIALVAEMHELESLLADLESEMRYLKGTMGKGDVQLHRILYKRYKSVAEKLNTVRVLLAVVYRDVMKKYA